ncbi:unnamed protein product [Thelazia callipaeda]|uniref:G protein-coupled receptor n=1 Tax=Thelazia callipaeda TaxID=103827 RepID=A0A0N5CQV3_THECL|nr:unnamed protein product [Thelazia callipaeda]
MQCISPIYLKSSCHQWVMPSGCYRSPYRLYRPYQLEVPPPSALVNGSATLYRTPNLDVLSEINRRSRRLERIVFYQKILAITQVCEICQPIFFVVASFVLLFCVLRPTKCTSQIAIASLVATIAPLLIFPTHSPFVISMFNSF